MRILIVQTGFLGDVILSTPVIGALRRLYPEAELWFLTTPQAAELLRRDPALTGVIVFDKSGAEKGIRGSLKLSKKLRSMGFSRAYSIHKSFRTAWILAAARIPRRIGFSDAKGSWLYHERVDRPQNEHEVRRALSIVSGIAEDEELRLFPPAKSELSEECAVLGTGYTVVVPGSVWATKRWKASGYHECVAALVARGEEVVVLGASSERAAAEEVSKGLRVWNLAGRTSLPELLYIISKARTVICNDSMALHIASAFKVPTVTVFCATSPKFGFGPWRNSAEVVERVGLYCKPCRRHGSMQCPTKTWACINEVSSREVLEAVDRVREHGRHGRTDAA